jgi:hypothetical protein
MFFNPISTLDQSQLLDDTDSGNGADTNNKTGETFVAGLSGILTKIELKIYKEADMDADLVVQLRNLIINPEGNNYPGETILATQIIAKENISLSATVISVIFDTPYTVLTGTGYAITLLSSSNVKYWARSKTDIYTPNKLAASQYQANPWYTGSGEVLYFKTYVII